MVIRQHQEDFLSGAAFSDGAGVALLTHLAAPKQDISLEAAYRKVQNVLTATILLLIGGEL